MVASLFRQQHGVISREQAIGAGLSRHAIDARLRRGEWERVDHGVYRHTAVAWTWQSGQVRHQLAANGITSHRAAARVLQIDDGRFGTHEVTIPSGRRHRREGVVVHESTQWDRISPVVVDGILVTSVDRTILDMGAVVRLNQVEMVADAALRSRLTSWPRLHETLTIHSKKGRDGCGVLRALLEERYGDPAIPLSRWSREVAQWATETGLPAPVLEFRVLDLLGNLVAQVDVAWPPWRVALELDSVAFHLDRAGFERDPRVRNRLRDVGWDLRTCTWDMWVNERPALRRSIWSALHAARSSDSHAG